MPKIELDLPEVAIVNLKHRAEKAGTSIEDVCVETIKKGVGALGILPDGVWITMKALPEGDMVEATYRETFCGPNAAKIIKDTAEAMSGLEVTHGEDWIEWRGTVPRVQFARIMIMEFGNWTPIMEAKLRDVFLGALLGLG